MSNFCDVPQSRIEEQFVVNEGKFLPPLADASVSDLNSATEGNSSRAEDALPKIDIFDSSDFNPEKVQQCILTEAENPSTFRFKTAMNLSSCDPSLKMLLQTLDKTCNISEEGKRVRAETAQKVLRLMREKEESARVMEPFREILLGMAYPKI